MLNWEIPKIEELISIRGKENQQYSILKKQGPSIALSALAIVLGASVNDAYHVKDDKTLKGRAGWILSSSRSDDGTYKIVYR